MTGDLRRELILSAARQCFARHGFAGTTTRAIAASAAVSEALLFKHFPSKSALYAAMLTDECEADPRFSRLLDREPSLATLVELVEGMVENFIRLRDAPDQQEAERLRLLASSQLDDGEFARLVYGKIGELIGPLFRASLDAAVAARQATRVGRAPLNLFWFAHHTAFMAALTRLPATPCLDYGDEAMLEVQICEFILRGIGVTDDALAQLERNPPDLQVCPAETESA